MDYVNYVKNKTLSALVTGNENVIVINKQYYIYGL